MDDNLSSHTSKLLFICYIQLFINHTLSATEINENFDAALHFQSGESYLESNSTAMLKTAFFQKVKRIAERIDDYKSNHQ